MPHLAMVESMQGNPVMGMPLPLQDRDLEARISPLAVQTNEGDVLIDGDDYQRDVSRLGYAKDRIQSYMNNHGQDLMDYMRKVHGREVKVDGIGSNDLGNAVAATLFLAEKKFGKRATYLLINRDYEREMGKFADNYGLSDAEAEEYVWTHEFVHASFDKSKKYDASSSGVESEEAVEKVLSAYFSHKAENAKDPAEKAKYTKMAAVAKYRTAEGKAQDKMEGQGNYKAGKGSESEEDKEDSGEESK